MASGKQRRKRAPARQSARGQKPGPLDQQTAPRKSANSLGPDGTPRSRSRPSGSRQAKAGGKKKRLRFLRGPVGWVATIVSGILIAAGTAWVLDFARTAGENSGPAMSAIADVDSLSTRCYALADPITSAADKVTLLSGTASPAQVTALLARHGGVNVGRLVLTLILEGRRGSLRIVNIQPQVRSVKPPAAAMLQYASAGSVDITQVTADLDSPVPQLDEGSQPYFNSKEIDLVRGERQTFRVTFEAATGSFEFNLLVTYVTGGKQYEQTIPGPARGYFLLSGLDAERQYGTVYAGVSENQFEVASVPQARLIFSKTQGCG